MLARELDDVGRRCVDEIADGVVRRVEHRLHVDQLEEDHEPDGQHGVVARPDVGHVVVHLVGEEPELLEDERVRHLLVARLPAARSVPREGVEPLAGLGDEHRRAVHHAARDLAVLVLAVDDDRLLARDLERVLLLHPRVLARIEPELRRADEVRLSPVAEAHDEELPRVRDVVQHRLDAPAAAVDARRPRDDGHLALIVDHPDALPVLHRVEEHADASAHRDRIDPRAVRRPRRWAPAPRAVRERPAHAHLRVHGRGGDRHHRDARFGGLDVVVPLEEVRRSEVLRRHGRERRGLRLRRRRRRRGLVERPRALVVLVVHGAQHSGAWGRGMCGSS